MHSSNLAPEHFSVVCGDAFEVLVGASGFDHVITDPPYDTKTHMGTSTLKGGTPSKVSLGFDPISPNRVFELCRLAKRWSVVFCSLEMLGGYAEVSGDCWIRSGIYRRTNPAPQFTGDRPGQSCEGIAIMHPHGCKRWNRGGHAAFWEATIERRRVHPTQKPLSLMRELLEAFTDEGDLVLDPFCGSGTTGVAALQLGRRFVGIELKPEHARVATQRCQEALEAYLESSKLRKVMAPFSGS